MYNANNDMQQFIIFDSLNNTDSWEFSYNSQNKLYQTFYSNNNIPYGKRTFFYDTDGYIYKKVDSTNYSNYYDSIVENYYYEIIGQAAGINNLNTSNKITTYPNPCTNQLFAI